MGATGDSDQVALLERPVEILADQPADFECLEIIGVVVAGREGVVAQHDPPLDLGPEAFAARRGVHVDQAVELLGPMSVVHAVVAGQVARRLARSDDVIGGHAVLGVRQRDVDDLGARAIDRRRPPRARRPPTSASSPAAKCSRGQADPQSGQRLLERAAIVGNGPIDRRRIARVVAGDHFQAAAAAPATSDASGPIWSSELAKATSP